MARTSRDPAKPARSRARARKPADAVQKPAGAVQADTPVEEANRRTEAGQPAPNPVDVSRAKNAVEAQGTADTAMLMGPSSDSKQEQGRFDHLRAQTRRGRLPAEGAAMTLHQAGQAKVYGTRAT